MNMVLLRICVDGWLTVRVRVERSDIFLDELLHGGHRIDSRKTVHVHTNDTSERGRCGWYAARRLVQKYAPAKGALLQDAHYMPSQMHDMYLRYEHVLDREIAEFNFPSKIERALIQRGAHTLLHLIQKWSQLYDHARRPPPRIAGINQDRIPLGLRSLDIIEDALTRKGLNSLLNVNVGHPDLATLLLVHERRMDRR